MLALPCRTRLSRPTHRLRAARLKQPACIEDIDIGGLPDAPEGKVVDRVDVIVRVRSRKG